MKPDTNKQIIREYVDTWNRGETHRLPNFWAADMVHHTRTLHQTRDEVKAVVTDFMSAFPDLHFEIDDIFGEEDRVVTRMTANATHSGAYMGFPPTGKKINCSVMGIARIENGKIVEHWGVTDELAKMAQIGMLPEQLLAAMT
jgi:C-1 hydroxylase